MAEGQSPERGDLPSSPGWSEEIAPSQTYPCDTPGPAIRLARFAFLEQGSVSVIKIIQFNAGNFLTDKALDGVYMPRIFRHHQSKGITFCFHSSCAADAM